MPGHRIDQSLHDGRRAAAHVRRHGGSPLAAACAQIEATFSPAARRAQFKRRVAALIRAGPSSLDVRLRYRVLAACLGPASLAGAIARVENLRDAEIAIRAAELRNWGAGGRPRLPLMLLDELRLILRFVRRFAPERFPGITAAVIGAKLARVAY